MTTHWLLDWQALAAFHIGGCTVHRFAGVVRSLDLFSIRNTFLGENNTFENHM